MTENEKEKREQMLEVAKRYEGRLPEDVSVVVIDGQEYEILLYKKID